MDLSDFLNINKTSILTAAQLLLAPTNHSAVDARLQLSHAGRRQTNGRNVLVECHTGGKLCGTAEQKCFAIHNVEMAHPAFPPSQIQYSHI